MDSSAIHSFLKISQIVENGHQVKLIYSQLKPGLKNLFIKGSVLNRKADTSDYDDLDRSLEWCEEQILNENGFNPDRLVNSMLCWKKYLRIKMKLFSLKTI